MLIDYSKYSNYELVELYYRIDRKRNADNIIHLEKQIKQNLNIKSSKKLSDPEVQEIFKRILYEEDPKNYDKFINTSFYKSSNKQIEYLSYFSIIVFILSYFFNLVPLHIPILFISVVGYISFIYSIRNKAMIFRGITLIEEREPYKFMFYQMIILSFSTIGFIIFLKQIKAI